MPSNDPFGDLLANGQQGNDAPAADEDPFANVSFGNDDPFARAAGRGGGPLTDPGRNTAWRSEPPPFDFGRESHLTRYSPPTDTSTPPVGSPLDGLGRWLNTSFNAPEPTEAPIKGVFDTPVLGGLLRGFRTGMEAVQQPGSLASDWMKLPTTEQITRPGAQLVYGQSPTDEQTQTIGRFNQSILGSAGMSGAFAPGGSLGNLRTPGTGSLGMADLRAPDVVPGSLGDIGRTQFPEGAPVQNPAAGPLRERMGLDQSSLNARQEALPAPEAPLALGPGDAISMPGSIAEPSPRGSFWQGTANERQIPQGGEPITAEQLRPQVVDTTARPIDTGPVPRLEPGRPYTFEDIRRNANIPEDQPLFDGPPVNRVNVPRDAEQLAAESKTITPGQQSFIDQQRSDISARQSQQSLDEQRSIGGLTARGIETTPIGRSDLNLKGERFQEPIPPVTMADLRARTGTENYTTPSGWQLDQRATAVHDANESIIAAMRQVMESPRATNAHYQAVLDAWQQVRDLGGSVENTNNRLRLAGLPKLPDEMVAVSPRKTAVEALTEQGVLRGRGKGGTNAPAAPAVTTLPDGGRGLLNRLGDAARKANADDIGGGRLPFDKNTRYGTPQEVAAANDPRLAALGRDMLKAEPITVPGGNELAAAKAAYDARTLRNPAARSTAEQYAGGTYVQPEASLRAAGDPRLSALGLSDNIPSSGGRGRLTMDGIKGGITDALNIPRTLMTTGDVSYSLRQGLVLGAGHPIELVKQMGRQLNAFRSERIALDYSNKMVADPAYGILKDLGLSLTDWTGKIGPLEEGFLSKSIGNAPIVRNSNRAAVTFLNGLRFNVAKGALRAAEIANPRTISATRQTQLKGLMEFINAASGRSELPKAMEKYGNTLNGLFFSPRFFLSRLNVAAAPIKAIATRNPLLAKEAARDISALVIGGVGVMQLAKMNGATVVDDPTSTDWGKIQVGNTRIDIWGGFQQPARFVSQMIAGSKTSISGKQTILVDNNPLGDLAMGAFGGGVKTKSGFTMHPDSRAYEAGRFIRGKFAPVPGTVVDMLSGKNYIGQDATPQSELGKSVTPLAFQDIYDAIADELKNGGSGVQGGLIGTLGLAGVGLTTIPKDYANTPTIPEAAFGAAFQGKPFFNEDAAPPKTSSTTSRTPTRTTSPLLRALQTAKPKR